MPDFFKQFPYTPPTAPEQDYQVANKKYVDRPLIEPATITVNEGTSSDVVGDLQTPYDGNVYHIIETGTTPGIDVEVNFTGIKHIDEIVILGYYEGLLSHYITVFLYNYTTTSWNGLGTIPHLAVTNQYVFIPPNSTDYVSSGAAIVRLDHVMAGTPNHDLYLDQVNIRGLST